MSDLFEAADKAATLADDSSAISYLLFRLQGELYATPLLKVREVIKMSTIKPVPYMVPHFRGVINLRGQIVGVVDLRTKLQMRSEHDSKGMVLITETPAGPIGAIVDEVEAVDEILPDQIDANPQVETKIPTSFFLGIARHEKGLVNLIDIAGCLSADELRRVKQGA